MSTPTLAPWLAGKTVVATGAGGGIEAAVAAPTGHYPVAYTASIRPDLRQPSAGTDNLSSSFGNEFQGSVCPAARKSLYHCSRLRNTSLPATASDTLLGVVVPSTTCIFAG